MTGNRWVELALDTIKDPMIWFLLGIGCVFLFVGDTSEAIVLFVAILPLVFMDAILHWRTQASTSNLKAQLESQVQVIRDEKKIFVHSWELVPGDIVIIDPGTFIPADGIFQETNDLQVDESTLTGESLPIFKKPSALDFISLASQGEIRVDSIYLGFAGTRVLTGTGILRVLQTGRKTSYGEIIESVSNLPHERTPLQKSITNLVQGLIVASGLLCVLLAGVRIYQGHGWLDALLSAATLAVAAIPEEFPVVFTFFLGVGVYRLAKRHALVRRAVSVENIGRVTHICTDKTGTITTGILQLSHLDVCQNLSEGELLRSAFLASNPDGSDPVDLAIREKAKKEDMQSENRIRTFAFTEDRKQETTFIRNDDGIITAYMKGSPETVLNKSNLSKLAQQDWKEHVTKWAREGHKVLGTARKVLTQEESNSDVEPKDGFEFCGLLAFEDSARPEVIDAISYCNKNQIRVLMITGDHPDTSLAIAKQVGLGGASPIAASAEEQASKFEEAWLNDHPDFLLGLHVVARCTPIQKLRIVNALKKSGELVAVTGDGINDVPALKAADVGIAMGERGTRSAKEVASMVLADDNFRTIVAAIREGRQLFTNLRLSFKYLLAIHIPLVLTAALIPLMGYPILYLPVHIVWLELIIHPSALFAFQQEAEISMKEDSKYIARTSFFDRKDISEILLLGFALTAALAFIFISGLAENVSESYARTRAIVMLTLWSAGLVALFSRLKTRTSILIVVCIVLSTILLVQIPSSAAILKLTPLPLADWVFIAACLASFLVFQAVLSKIFQKNRTLQPTALD